MRVRRVFVGLFVLGADALLWWMTTSGVVRVQESTDRVLIVGYGVVTVALFIAALGLLLFVAYLLGEASDRSRAADKARRR